MVAEHPAQPDGLAAQSGFIVPAAGEGLPARDYRYCLSSAKIKSETLIHAENADFSF
jgi:hypothetical protein